MIDNFDKRLLTVSMIIFKTKTGMLATDKFYSGSY